MRDRSPWDGISLLVALMLGGVAAWALLLPGASLDIGYRGEPRVSSGTDVGLAVLSLVAALGFVWLGRPRPIPPPVERIGSRLGRGDGSDSDELS